MPEGKCPQCGRKYYGWALKNGKVHTCECGGIIQLVTVIKIVCAWCGKDMGTKDGKGVEGITHGICPECLIKQIGEHDK